MTWIIRQHFVFAWMPAVSIYFEDPDGHSLEFISMLPDQPEPNNGIVEWNAWEKSQGRTLQMFLSNLFDDPRRIAGNSHVVRHVFSDNGPGADNDIISDSYPRVDDRSPADPDIITDRHRLAVFRP